MVANFTWWWAQTAKKKRISWLIMVFVRGAKIKNVRVCERNKWRLLSSHRIYTFVCIYEKKDNDRIQLKLCANLKARCQHCRNKAKWTWLLHIPELSLTQTELKIFFFCVSWIWENDIICLNGSGIHHTNINRVYGDTSNVNVDKKKLSNFSQNAWKLKHFFTTIYS